MCFFDFQIHIKRKSFWEKRVNWLRALQACVVFLLIAFAPRPGLAVNLSGNYGTIIINGDNNTSDNTTINILKIGSFGSLTESAGHTLTVNGDFTLNGTLTNEGIVLANGTTLINGGTINNSGTSMSITTLAVDSGYTGILTGSTLTSVTTGNIYGTMNYIGTGGLSLPTLNLYNGTFNNNGSGAVSIGTVAVSTGNTGTIGGTGSIQLTTADVNGTLTVNTILSGSGQLTKTGTGTVILTGANTYTGGTTVSAGTLQGNTTSLQGNITDNAAVVFDQISTGTYSGVISGTGSLAKTGTGKLILTGANNYTGATNINAGTLSVNGSITSPVTISAAGTLMGSGTITGNVTNAGTLAPGNSIGTLTIAGNYTQNAGSTYQVEVNSAGQSDKLAVTGTATLNGGTVSVLADSGTYNMSTNYTILTAGSIAGTFANVTSNLAFLTPSLSYDANDVYLTLTRNTTDFADVAATSDQYGVASALDRVSPSATGDMSTVMNNLLSLSASGAGNAYNQMGGFSHTSLTGATFVSMNNYLNTLSGRMAGFNTGGVSLAGTENILLAFNENTGSDAGNMLVSAIRNAREEDASPWGLWAKGYGNLGNRRGDDISTKYDYNGGGLIAGFDRKVTENLLLGAAAGYSYTKVNMNDLSDNNKVAGYQGFLYGAYNSDPWYVNGLIAYSYNRYNSARNIAFGSIARTANADYDGNSLSGYMEGGYQFKTEVVNIIPLASIQVSSLWRNAFTENDAGALNLAVDSDRNTSFIGALGFKLNKEYKTKNGSLIPEFRCKWLHEFNNSDYMLNASFTGYPVSTFSVRGDQANRDSAAVGAGLSWEIDKSFALAITYDAVLSGDRTEHGGTLGLRFRW